VVDGTVTVQNIKCRTVVHHDVGKAVDGNHAIGHTVYEAGQSSVIDVIVGFFGLRHYSYIMPQSVSVREGEMFSGADRWAVFADSFPKERTVGITALHGGPKVRPMAQDFGVGEFM